MQWRYDVAILNKCDIMTKLVMWFVTYLPRIFSTLLYVFCFIDCLKMWPPMYIFFSHKHYHIRYVFAHLRDEISFTIFCCVRKDLPIIILQTYHSKRPQNTNE